MDESNLCYVRFVAESALCTFKRRSSCLIISLFRAIYGLTNYMAIHRFTSYRAMLLQNKKVIWPMSKQYCSSMHIQKRVIIFYTYIYFLVWFSIPIFGWFIEKEFNSSNSFLPKKKKNLRIPHNFLFLSSLVKKFIWFEYIWCRQFPPSSNGCDGIHFRKRHVN